jgi:RHS repeat-associated protein
MKIILSISLFVFSLLSFSQTVTENFVKNTTYKDSVKTSIGTPTVLQALQNVTYYDGIGRPKQVLQSKQSATGMNVVRHIEYDAFGREQKSYLPYTNSASDLNYVAGSTAKSETLNYSAYIGQSPFSEIDFEASPLNRVVKKYAPGTVWSKGQNNEIELLYQANSTNEVRLFRATSTSASGIYSIALSQTGGTFYAAGELYKIVTRNENWTNGTDNTTEEYKDKEGRIILKRTWGVSSVGITPGTASNQKHDTYYVYDQYGNLTFVIPPKVDTSVSPASVLDDLCYQYKYDYKNRLVEKKVPGKAWEFIVYDKAGRMVETGPAYSPFGDMTVGWLVTRYDALNRVAFTGWYASTVTSAARALEQTAQNGLSVINVTKQASGTIDGIAAWYSNNVVPMGIKLLTANYYDNYSFPDSPTISATVMNDNSQKVYYNGINKPKGLPTASWSRALQGVSMTDGESSYVLYDKKSRPVRSYSKNYLGGYTYVDNKIDFSGKVIYSETHHKRVLADPEIFTKDMYTYTNQDRLSVHSHQVGTSGTPQLLAKNTYNELGQLIGKKTGGTDLSANTYFQNISLAYNIRGWLTSINDVGALAQGTDPIDLFAFKLNYDAPQVTGTQPLFNGNISETLWRTNSDNKLRSYSYQFDTMDRLTAATYQKSGVSGPNSYGESLTYDKNGNIMTLQRNGDYDDVVSSLATDNLSYFYENSSQSNKLMKVTDATNNPNGFADDSDGTNDTADDYGYDLYGNVTADANKGVTITYNHLNLPVKITANLGVIDYLYNATGQKLKKTVLTSITNTSDYLSGFQYTNSLLGMIPTAEGYVKNTVVNGTNNYNYVFTYKDHLGNVRLSYGLDPVSGTVKILEESNYYPFGLKHKNYNMTERNYYKGGGGVVLQPCTTCPATFSYNYKFNGKEWQDDLALNLYDYGARYYDPAIGRWLNTDPLADKYRRWTPYGYVMDNPVFFIDPDGMRSSPNGGDSSPDGKNVVVDESGRVMVDQYGVYHALLDREAMESDVAWEDEHNESSFYPDPNSFQFTTRNGWQESAVLGIYFKIVLVEINSNGASASIEYRISFDQAVLFTVPTNLTVGDTKITNKVASKSTANIVNRVMARTANLFAGTETSPMQVEQFFRRELKREYQMSIPGARVIFNSMNHTITPTIFRHN